MFNYMWWNKITLNLLKSFSGSLYWQKFLQKSSRTDFLKAFCEKQLNISFKAYHNTLKKNFPYFKVLSRFQDSLIDQAYKNFLPSMPSIWRSLQLNPPIKPSLIIQRIFRKTKSPKKPFSVPTLLSKNT